MAAVSDAKRRYMLLDLGDWIRHWNAINAQEGSPDKPIEFRWPDQFPIRTPTLLRCAITDPSLVPLLCKFSPFEFTSQLLCERTTLTCYLESVRACWERNINVSDEKTLTDYLDSAGYDAAAVLKKATSPDVKTALRNNTQEALEAGVCGVPSYRVFDKTDQGWAIDGLEGGVVWGQDELVVVEDLVAGWKQKESLIGGYDSPAQQVQGASSNGKL